MTIFIIVLVLIAVIVIPFIIDYKKEEVRMPIGGAHEKYRTLIDYILASDERCRIVHENKLGVTIMSKAMGGSTQIDIAQTFGTVSIRWRSKSALFGDHEREWEFPEDMDQEDMYIKMNLDIQKYLEQLFGSSSTENY